MFGISFGEIMLVALVGFLLLKPEDIKTLYVQIIGFLNSVDKETSSIKNAIKEIADKELMDKQIYSVDDAISADVSRKISD